MLPSPVIWPVEADLTNWLGDTYTTAPDAAVRVTEAFSAADGAVRLLVDEETLGADTETSEDFLCYGPIRQAILILGGRLFARKDTLTGALSFGGDSMMNIRKSDPDVYALLEPFGGSGC